MPGGANHREKEDHNEPLVFTAQEREAFAKAGVKVRYPKDQIIFAAEEYADRVYLIEEGYVKIYRLSPYGQEFTVGRIRSPGELLGVAEVLYHGARQCFAGALTDVTLVVLTKTEFLDLLLNEPRLAVKVATLMAERMRAAEDLIYNLVCWQVPGRLAKFLLNLGEQCGIRTENGIKIGFKLTHGEIASIIGCTRQTVTALMKTLRGEGCIAVERRNIVIKDPEKLAGWLV